MAPVLFAYVLATNVVKAPNTLVSPIVIKVNNVPFIDTIPLQHQDSVIEDFVEYLKCCPLRYALSDIPDPFFPKQVCEF